MAELKKDVSEILDAKVYEVSIVGEPANEREFLMLKAKNGGVNMDNIIKEILESKIENESEVEKVIKEIDINDEGAYALRNMLKIVQTYADVLPKDLLGSMAKLLSKAGDYDEKELLSFINKQEMDRRSLAGELAGIWDITTGEALEFINAIDPTEPQDRTVLAGVISREYEGLSPVDVLEVLADAEEQAGTGGDEMEMDIEKSLEKMPDNVKPIIEKLYKEHKETAEKASRLEDEKIEKEFIDKAKTEFGTLPVESAEFGKLLKSIHEKAPDEYTQLEGLLKALNGQINESELFKEVGSDSKGTSGAWAKIEKSAKEYAKDNPNISEAQAVSKIITENPELYLQYMQEENSK